MLVIIGKAAKCDATSFTHRKETGGPASIRKVKGPEYPGSLSFTVLIVGTKL